MKKRERKRRVIGEVVGGRARDVIDMQFDEQKIKEKNICIELQTGLPHRIVRKERNNVIWFGSTMLASH